MGNTILHELAAYVVGSDIDCRGLFMAALRRGADRKLKNKNEKTVWDTLRGIVILSEDVAEPEDIKAWTDAVVPFRVMPRDEDFSFDEDEFG
jgi:hypothetical protein